ncbi:transcriptional regulator [Mycolicibacterium moriokaense]|uniref:helix-turn-helix transcriptional regulator n=1 Tax=Mycolicibacterium moriokaense TaxID=39691 RepID=UPI0009F38C19|nr:helix-turn-helix transcriptional regulator [Mycolicibacterium moriokaense]MCV7042153.1 helix-turn-helix transcriptional regulator [Mycolicibacterium moriokaense]ORB25253.1 transcriptional regulator [Mycolicibacterium moriokaense]
MPQDENIAAVVSNAAQDIGTFIRTQREAAQVSVRQLAEKAGVSNPYLSQIERGLRKPSADVLNQIAKALRVSAEVLYIRAGILEPSENNQVRDVIITDTAITERQKQVLLEIYTSFVQQNEAQKNDAAATNNEEPTTDQTISTPELVGSTTSNLEAPNLEEDERNHPNG